MFDSVYAQCPICHLRQEVKTRDGGERISVRCTRCGHFTITRTAAHQAENSSIAPGLMAWLRERTEAGSENPEISTYSLKSIQENIPSYRVSQKQLLVLRALERKSKFPGAEIVLKPMMDYPLGWASTELEFRYLLAALQGRRLIQTTGGTLEDVGSAVVNVRITPEGWSHLEDRSSAPLISDKAFVAMAFADKLVQAWEGGIRPAIKKAGFHAYRVDIEPHSDRIDMKIMSEIKTSRFVVADVTLQRPGVYFEAGYAIGLGIPVIWCVKRDELSKVHFDTRQYNHIVWNDPTELEDQLHSFVVAIIGHGPAKVP